MLLISKMVSCSGIPQGKHWIAGFFLLLQLCAAPCVWAGAAEVERILQKGFPTRPAELEKTSAALFEEYSATGNLSSLLFYSYSVLNLAEHAGRINDAVRAAELAKTGFFYLDEAVDRHEKNWRVRYLRARVDAWLPEKLGRCVITLADTDELLAAGERIDSTLVPYVKYMRYRALRSCRETSEQSRLLRELRAQGADGGRLLSAGDAGPLAWETAEVVGVLFPLIREE